MISRRQFLKAGVATAAVASVGGFLSPRKASAFVQSPGIPLFKTTLRGVGPGGIPVAAPDTVHATVIWVPETSTALSEFESGTNTRDPTTAAVPYGDPPMAAVASAELTCPRLEAFSK